MVLLHGFASERGGRDGGVGRCDRLVASTERRGRPDESGRMDGSAERLCSTSKVRRCVCKERSAGRCRAQVEFPCGAMQTAPLITAGGWLRLRRNTKKERDARRDETGGCAAEPSTQRHHTAVTLAVQDRDTTMREVGMERGRMGDVFGGAPIRGLESGVANIVWAVSAVELDLAAASNAIISSFQDKTTT